MAAPARWMPGWVTVGVVDLPAGGDLWGAERAATRSMGAGRANEFAAGRAAARLALAGLGRPPAPIPVGDHRQPQWPAGVRGSISHDEEVAVAAVADAADCSGIGIDVIAADAVDDELWGTVLSTRERAVVVTSREPAGAATAVFASKEAVFKALFPLTGRWLDFCDVEVVLGPRPYARVTGIRPRVELAPVRHAGRWWVGAWLDAPALRAR